MFSFDGSLLGRSILVTCDVVDVQEGFQFLKEEVQDGPVAIVACEARDGLVRSTHANIARRTSV